MESDWNCQSSAYHAILDPIELTKLSIPWAGRVSVIDITACISHPLLSFAVESIPSVILYPIPIPITTPLHPNPSKSLLKQSSYSVTATNRIGPSITMGVSWFADLPKRVSDEQSLA